MYPFSIFIGFCFMVSFLYIYRFLQKAHIYLWFMVYFLDKYLIENHQPCVFFMPLKQDNDDRHVYLLFKLNLFDE